MPEPEAHSGLPSPSRRRIPIGAILQGAGLVMIVWAALGLSAAGYGNRPTRIFAERRSYNMVKVDVHDALPTAALRGVLGLLLLGLGARLRPARLPSDPAPPPH